MIRTIFQIRITVNGRPIQVGDVSPTEAVQKLLKELRKAQPTDDEIIDARVEILEQNTDTWKTERW